jgi:Mg-chelatase subunit ChlI
MTLQNHFKKIFLEEDPFKDILGQTKAKSQLKSALLAGRHVILVGPPGIGKTTLAKNVAKILPNQAFVRIQGSPDLAVEDLLGDIDPIKALTYGPLSVEAFTKGKIFKADKGVLFFDEINRCPEKLQNALLQVLEEKNATIGSYDVDFGAEFVLIATMNPQDTNTERLSEVLLDRFDVIYIEYPETQKIEEDIVRSKNISLVTFPDNLLHLIVQFVRRLRVNKNLEKIPGVRATLGLYERAQANAYLKQKQEVTFIDIQEAIISVLSHRIKLKPSVEYLKDPVVFMKEELDSFMVNHEIVLDKQESYREGDSP